MARRLPSIGGVFLLAFLAVNSPTASAQSQGWVPQPVVPVKKSATNKEFGKPADSTPPKTTEPGSPKIEVGRLYGSVILPLVIYGGIALVVLAAGAWVYVKLSPITDPAKLAASDPWILRRLAQGDDYEPTPEEPVAEEMIAGEMIVEEPAGRSNPG